MIRTDRLFATACLALCTGLAAPAFAQGIDRKINYQGQLQGTTGTVTIQFRIYDAIGAVVWGPELHIVTPDAEGRFVAVVGATGLDTDGDGPDLDELDPDGLELEVTIEESGQSPVVLSPRQSIFAAFHASSSSSVIDSSVSRPKLVQDVQDSLVPTGAILPFAGSAGAVPVGWLLCDGAELQQVSFPSLFAVIGSAHGGAAGTFRVPDYRGRHLRGVDGGVGRDPSRTTRTAMAAGGDAGDTVGSVEQDQLQNHFHTASSPAHNHSIAGDGNHRHNVARSDGTLMRLGDGDDSAPGNMIDQADPGDLGPLRTDFQSHSHTAGSTAVGVSVSNVTSARVGAETRVDSAFVNFIIRCGPGDAC